MSITQTLLSDRSVISFFGKKNDRLRPTACRFQRALLRFFAAALAFLPISVLAQNPLAGNQGFQILSEGNLTFTGYTHVHGALGVGGNLVLNCNGVLAEICMDGVSSYVFPGDGTTTTGLLVKGGITWTNGGAKVMGGKYMHIGSSTGCTQSDNGVNMATQVLPTGGSYNQAKRLEGALDQTPSPAVFQTVGLDFAGLFSTYRSVSGGMAACANNVQLYNSANAAIAGNTVSTAQNVQINSLANGVNYLDLTQASLNNITELKFNAGALPNASKLLVITVPLTSNFVWNNANLPALSGSANGPYIIWNFTGATTYNLTINTASLIIGTIFAPNHNLVKTGTGDIDGNIVAKTISLGVGEVHYFPFNGNIPLCSENCSNGTDDDYDGLVDAADPNCSCSSPILSFQNPSLVSGTAGAVGAVYEFSNVLAGTKARVTLVSKSHSDIDITSIDEPAFSFGGYDNAFQPIIDYNWLNWDGTFDPAGEKSVTFRIDFLDAATGLAKQLPIVNATGLDIDGSEVEVIEFIESSGFNAYEIQSPTNLTLSGGLKAKGTLTTFPGVDETALSNMISYVFHNKSSITITFGGDFNGVTYDFGDSGVGFSDEKRLNSLYLKCYAFDVTVTCPTVTINGGGAICSGQTSTLTATVTGGAGTAAYQWQSSTDNATWSNISGATGATYTASPSAATNYYRLASTFSGNTSCGTIYSNSLPVSLGTTGCSEDCNNFVDDNDNGLVDGADPSCAANCGAAGLVLERWTGISGVIISDLTSNANYPNSPSTVTTLTNFDGPDDYADNYGSRVRGYIVPTTTGAYTFNLTSDDYSVLYLSTDDKVANKVQIASVSGWTATNGHTTYSSQTSSTINLVAGKYYYVELLHKEGTGGDHFQVYWKTPSNSTWTIIPASNLMQVYCPVEVCGNGLDDDGDGLTDGADGDCMSFCPAGSLTLERWTGISGTSIPNLTGIAAYPNSPNFTGTISSFDGPDNVADNYGTRIRGYIEPSLTGTYTFNLTGDDDCYLYLSTNVQSASKVLIASIAGWTNTTEYTKYASQTSASVSLVAGQKYYVELLHKEGSGGDHFQVYWTTPASSTWTIVPGANLRPFACTEICNNGTDDDGDGLTDCADSECPAPAPSVTGNNLVCSGAFTSLTATGGGTYAWSNGGTTATITVSPTTTTTYTVTVTNTAGCTATSARTVTVNGLPVPAIAGTNTICAGGSTTLTASGGSTYAWSNSSTSAAITVSPTATTTYTVTVTNAAGCTATATRTVTVNATPTAEAGSNLTVCNGSVVNLSANATGGVSPYTFTWNNGLGIGAAKTVTPTTGATYMVTVTGNNGCTASDQVTVGVNAVPVVDAGVNQTVCLGLSANLAATASGAPAPFAYNWSNGLGNAASAIATPSANQTYYVTVTSSNGCIGTDAVMVTVQNCAEVCNNGLDDDADGFADCADTDCGPSVDLGNDVSLCQGTSTLLTAAVSGGGSGAISFTWSNGLGSGQTKTVSPATTTTYSVTATSQSGCTDVDQITVTVQDCSENCTDNVDNDGDGLVDCADPDCMMVTAPALANDSYTTCPGLPYSNRVTYNDLNLQSPVFSIAVPPTKGVVTIDETGKFVYMPNDVACQTDQFTYQVCNQPSGCCATAVATIVMGDVLGPVLTNVPADLTINCEDVVPDPTVVTAYDECPGVYISFTESSDEYAMGACGTYTITRTWTATDLCGNITSDQQLIHVKDETHPEIFQVYTLKGGEKLAAGVSQRVSGHWKYVRFPITFKAPPVVLANLASNNEVAPAAVQVRHVTMQGFEMRLKSEEALAAAHGTESVTWLAMDAGARNENMKWEAGTFANVGHELDTLLFAQHYGTAPLFFSSFLTNAQSDPASLRHVGLSGTGVAFFAQEEQSADSETARLSETAGYLAIDASSLLVDKLGNVFGESGKLDLTNAWATVSLTKKYTKPVVIIGGLTHNNSEPVTVRVRNVTTDGFEVRLQEWNYTDGSHPLESVSWMVVEGSIPGTPSYYCSGKDEVLVPRVNVFAVDNCDNLVTLDYSKSRSLEADGLLMVHTWSTSDDCGNASEVSRTDTCQVAALKLKALLYGAVTGSNITNMMRDNLRSLDFVPTVEPYTGMPGMSHVEYEVHELLADTVSTPELEPQVEICHLPGTPQQASLTVKQSELAYHLGIGDLVGECGSSDLGMVTICHKPGTPAQKTMVIPQSALLGHLGHGDFVGACSVSGNDNPTGAQAAEHRTIADGLWTSASTWANGNVPPLTNINNKTISVEHNVTIQSSDLHLKNNSTLWVTHGSIKMVNGKFKIDASKAYFESSTFDGAQAGNIELTSSQSLLVMTDCNVKVGQSFNNTLGTRKLRNVQLEVSENFYNTTGIDTLVNVCAVVDNDFTNAILAKMYLHNVKLRLPYGSFTNFLGNTIAGDSLVLLIESENLQNLGLWSAGVLHYCVAGTSILPPASLPQTENCVNIANYFNPCHCEAETNSGSNDGGYSGANPLGDPALDDLAMNPGKSYGGGTMEPAKLAIFGSDAVVDWLLVELRSMANEAEVLGYQSVLVQRDGDLVSESWDSVLLFPGLEEGDYYVSIRHRNHLGQMSDSPIFLSVVDPPLVDFTDPNFPLKGGPVAGRVVDGKRTLWGGDFNHDGKVIYQGPYNDVFTLFSRVVGEESNTNFLANFIVPGYESEDFNLDGKVIYQGPNNDRATLLYHTVLAHSGNSNLLANFIASDLLP